MEEKKRWIQSVFDRAAAVYGGERTSFFGTFGKRLVEHSGVTSGMDVLDVACGRGAVLFPAARKVGSKGRVVGIDISSEMVKLTKARVEADGLHWVTVQRLDAEKLPFEDESFDVVLCGFALFFFPSLHQALAEFRRVLKPSGVLAVTIWGQKPWLSAWVNAEAHKLGATGSLAESLLADEASLKEALSKAEFESIKIGKETSLFWHQSEEAWWQSLWEHGTRARLEQLESKDLEQLKSAALAKAQEIHEERGVPEQLQVIYGVARKEKR